MEIPDEKIASAEEIPSDHDHTGVLAEDGTLISHLRGAHGFDAPARLSPTTLDGLHDRLHHETKATDDR